MHFPPEACALPPANRAAKAGLLGDTTARCPTEKQPRVCAQDVSSSSFLGMLDAHADGGPAVICVCRAAA